MVNMKSKAAKAVKAAKAAKAVKAVKAAKAVKAVKAVRVTAIEKKRRILKVQVWIVDGVPDYLITAKSVKKWSVSTRQSRRYTEEAYKLWRKDEESTINDKRQAKIAELKKIRRSIKKKYKGTPSGVLAIMCVEKEIIKLEAITPPKKFIVGGDKENPLEINQVVIFQIPDNNRNKNSE